LSYAHCSLGVEMSVGSSSVKGESEVILSKLLEVTWEETFDTVLVVSFCGKTKVSCRSKKEGSIGLVRLK